MKNVQLLLLAFFLSISGMQAQTYCQDRSNYPDNKNTGGTSTFTLRMGYEEMAAQTYHYSGPGVISQVRVYGRLTTGLVVPVKVVVYSVDNSGRPATALRTVNIYWTLLDNIRGYRDISVGSLTLDDNFAVAFGFGTGASSSARFDLSFNGNGEGRAEDLSSLSGTSTGNNWASVKKDFSLDGDFYIMPEMIHYITAKFNTTKCVDVNAPVAFTNISELSTDSMFNKIMLGGYSGSNHIYKWEFGDNTPVSYDANPSHTYTTAGKYTVKLTATIEGWQSTCTDVYTMDISVGLSGKVNGFTMPGCHGSSDGSLNLGGQGGAAPYQYSINNQVWQQSGTFSDLAAGNYTLYVKDALGCVRSWAYTLNQPTAITISSSASTSATCGNANGSILVTAGGGTGPLQYSLDNTTWQATGAFGSLAAGNYVMYIKDSMGCSLSHNIGVRDAVGPTIKLNGFNNISCAGAKDGSITVGSTGGSGTPQYSINGTTYQASGTFSGLAAGTYLVSVKDGAGCMDNMSVTITQPSAITFTATADKATCKGTSTGKITVMNAIGGTGTLRYSIDGTYYQNGNVFSGLPAGPYNVYVRDAVGCTKTATANVGEPDAVTSAIVVTNATCHGSSNGTITVTGAGGTLPYRYSIDGATYVPAGYFSGLAAGTYTVTVMDANGCSYSTNRSVTEPTQVSATITTTNTSCGASNGKILAVAGGGSGAGYTYSLDGVAFSSSGLFNDLVDSTYSVVVRDGAGCTNVFVAVVTNNDGPQITSLGHTNVSCFNGNDGTITVNGTSGGTGALSYSIDGFTWQSGTQFSNLAAGDYIVRVRDNVGCNGSATVKLTAPSEIVVSVAVTNATCNGSATGKVEVSAAGGVGTLAYSLNGVAYQSSNTFNNLKAGHYVVYVRDAGNCSNIKTFTVREPEAIQFISMAVSHVTCHNANNGLILAGANGGTGAITYSIDGTTYNTSGIFMNLEGGSYTVYAKDANNCVKMQTVTINEPMELDLSSQVSDVSCANGNNGVINITVTGGTAPYTYTWSNQRYTEDQFNLEAGNYSVTVRDNNGCTISATFEIEQPDEPIVVNGVVANATSGNNGGVDITVSGGVPPYSYFWSNNTIAEDLAGVGPGTYTVQITDANDCQTSASFSVAGMSGMEKALDGGKSIKVYPNPANDLLNIQCEGARIERIDIFNSVGQLVHTQTATSETIQLNIAHLNPGIYILQYRVDGVNAYQRIEIAR